MYTINGFDRIRNDSYLLKIEVNEEFLESATYPIVIDPTIRKIPLLEEKNQIEISTVDQICHT